MLQKLHDILIVAGGIMATMLTACSSEEPLAEEPKGDLFVTIEARSPRAGEDATSDVHSDLTLQEGIVLIYDENGVYEGGDRIDPDKRVASLRIPEGKKRIVVLANAPKILRDRVAIDCHTPITDEYGNVKTYKGDTVWSNIKPVYRYYAELKSSLSFSDKVLQSVQSSHRMVLIHDNIVNVAADEEDSKTSYVEIPLAPPMARVDLHARCLPSETSRIAGAAIRVSKAYTKLNWNLSYPNDETTNTVTVEFSDVSDKMTPVVTENELFSDWILENVKEDSPIASLYTYYTDANAVLEIGLLFKGSVEYDWYPIEMSELLKPGEYKGLEAGHLYQIFITIYPDKVGHIIVDPWVVPSNLEFTIG